MPSFRRITATPHINAITELISYYEPLYISNDRNNLVTELCCSLETSRNFTDVKQSFFIKREVCEAISKSIQEKSVVLNIVRFDNMSTKGLINPYNVMREIQNNFNYKTWSFGSNRKAHHRSCRNVINDTNKSSEPTKLCHQCFPRSKSKKSKISKFSSRNFPPLSQSIGLGHFIQFLKKLFKKQEIRSDQSSFMQSFMDGPGFNCVPRAKPVLQPSKEHYSKTPSERLRVTRSKKNEKEKNNAEFSLPIECHTETLSQCSTRSNAIVGKKDLDDILLENGLKSQCNAHIVNEGNKSCIENGKDFEKKIEQARCTEMSKLISEDKNLHENKINNTQEERIQQIRCIEKKKAVFPSEMCYLKNIKSDSLQENRIGLQIIDEKKTDRETEICHFDKVEVCKNLEDRKEQIRHIDIKNNISEAEISILKEDKKVNIQGDGIAQKKCIELAKDVSETKISCINKNIDDTKQQKEQIRCMDVNNNVSEPEISFNGNKICCIQEERINQLKITEMQNAVSSDKMSIHNKEKIVDNQQNTIDQKCIELNKNDSEAKMSFVNENKVVNIRDRIKQINCIDVKQDISSDQIPCIKTRKLDDIQEDRTQQMSNEINRGVPQIKYTEQKFNKDLSDANISYHQKGSNHNQKNNVEQEMGIEMNKKAFSEANISDFINTEGTGFFHKNPIGSHIESPNFSKIPCVNMAKYQAMDKNSSKNIMNLKNDTGENTQNDGRYSNEAFDEKLLKLENICTNTKKFYEALKDLKMYSVSKDKCESKCPKKCPPKKDGCKKEVKEENNPCQTSDICSFKKKPIKGKPCNALTPNKEFKTYTDDTLMPKKYKCGSGAIEKKVRENRKKPPAMMKMTEDEARSRFGKP